MEKKIKDYIIKLLNKKKKLKIKKTLIILILLAQSI